MRLSHLDYIKLVIETYHRKRVNNELSLLLAQPTPASLRKECVNVYRERYERKDENILRGFFGSEEPGKKLIDVIEYFDINKFKPIVNYLKREDKKGVNDTNLEILAWLINFQHRPFIRDKEVFLNDEELSILGKPVNKPTGGPSIKTTTEEAPIATHKPAGMLPAEPDIKTPVTEPAVQIKKEKRRSERAVIIFLILVIVMGGIYTIWQEKQRKQIALGNANTGCMYWTGDHYEEVPCGEDGHFKLPLDRKKLGSFKKILREDTITRRSIGKVHYIKINKKLEFYTTAGNHPIDLTRRLWPLSPYMYEKYLGGLGDPNKDSVADRDMKLVHNP